MSEVSGIDRPTLTLERPTPRRSLGHVTGSVLDEPGAAEWERRPGAVVRVLFPGIPLSSWREMTAREALEALDEDRRPSGVTYRVTSWHTGGTRPSPTGHDLHLVYATLLCLEPGPG